MEQASAPPTPPPEPPAGATDQSQPATREDVRWLGRWLVVVALWAAAASAVAILALIDARNQESAKGTEAKRLDKEISGLRQDLVSRTGRLQTQLETLPNSRDVARLEKRLAKVEDDASKASADAKKAGSKVADLESRVKTLESSSKSAGAKAKAKGP
jgi:chromosome segregation ATPase